MLKHTNNSLYRRRRGWGRRQVTQNYCGYQCVFTDPYYGGNYTWRYRGSYYEYEEHETTSTRVYFRNYYEKQFTAEGTEDEAGGASATVNPGDTFLKVGQSWSIPALGTVAYKVWWLYENKTDFVALMDSGYDNPNSGDAGVGKVTGIDLVGDPCAVLVGVFGYGTGSQSTLQTVPSTSSFVSGTVKRFIGLSNSFIGKNT